MKKCIPTYWFDVKDGRKVFIPDMVFLEVSCQHGLTIHVFYSFIFIVYIYSCVEK